MHFVVFGILLYVPSPLHLFTCFFLPCVSTTPPLYVCIFTLLPLFLSLSFAVSQVRTLHGIPALVQLFSSENRAVQRYATGAMRNLIYENADNKAALVKAGGVTHLVNVLREPDEELRKTVTGNCVYGLIEILSCLMC